MFGAGEPLNEGREINPGDTGAARRDLAGVGALNEGREINPGDTRNIAADHLLGLHAQRRPGD